MKTAFKDRLYSDLTCFDIRQMILHILTRSRDVWIKALNKDINIFANQCSLFITNTAFLKEQSRQDKANEKMK